MAKAASHIPTFAVLVALIFPLGGQWGDQLEQRFIVYSVISPDQAGRIEDTLTSLPGWYIISTTQEKLDQQAIRAGIIHIIPERWVYAHDNPPEWINQWALVNTGQYLWHRPICPWDSRTSVLGADANVIRMWETLEGKGVTIAVLDTGIDAEHPEFQGRIAETVSFVPMSDPGDRDGHGTHVAGIIASARNHIEPVGVLPQAHIISVKVLDDTGAGALSWIIKGFNWIIGRAREGLRVHALNASWGGHIPPEETIPLWRDIMNALNELNIPVIASAGNRGREVTLADFPCGLSRTFQGMLCVAAFSPNARMSCFSNCSSTLVQIIAPGEDILSTLPAGQMGFWSGTSMSAPIATAAVAAVQRLTTDTQQTFEIIRQTAIHWSEFPKRPQPERSDEVSDFPMLLRTPSGCSPPVAWGVIDVASAVERAR